MAPLSSPRCPKIRCRLALRIGIRTAWIIVHHRDGVDVLLSDLSDSSLRHWLLPTVPDAGQRDPPEPLAKDDEAQLREFCLVFLDLTSRSLANMACRSSGMFLDTTQDSL